MMKPVASHTNMMYRDDDKIPPQKYNLYDWNDIIAPLPNSSCMFYLACWYPFGTTYVGESDGLVLLERCYHVCYIPLPFLYPSDFCKLFTGGILKR